MSIEQSIAELTDASNHLTSEVSGKINQIDQQVAKATTQIPNQIRQQFNLHFYVDQQKGDDKNDGLSAATAFKTLAQAFSDATSPHGASIRVDLVSDYALTSHVYFTNKHIHLWLNGHTFTFKSFKSFDTSNVDTGDGIARLQGHGHNSALVILDGKLVTEDCVPSGKGNAWFYQQNRTMIQMGGVDQAAGFYPVTLHSITAKLGQNVQGIAAGDRGANVYGGQGVVSATLYLSSVDTSAKNSTTFGSGVYFQNNAMYDADGHKLQVVSNG